MQYMRLRSLIESPEDALGGAFTRIASELPGDSGSVQFRVVGDGDDDEPRFWSASAGAAARAAATEEPALEIVAKAETYRRMVDGSYSPLEAFLDGRMRVRGDIELGKQLLKRLGQPGGITDVC